MPYPSRRQRRRRAGLTAHSRMNPLNRDPLEAYHDVRLPADVASLAASLRATLQRPEHVADAVGGMGLDPSVIEAHPDPLVQAERLRRYRERQAQLQRAQALAEELLEDHVDEQQLADLRRHQAFEVTASGGTRYLIVQGRAGNVLREPEPGRRVSRRFCVHPRMFVPDMDTMLAQALWLQADEDAFLALANEHQPMKPPAWWHQRLTAQ